METSYFLLIITCFLYGASQMLKSWDGFTPKLINVLAILAIIVLLLLTGRYGFFNYYFSEWHWLNYIIPAGAVCLGFLLGGAIKDKDWVRIIKVLAGLGLIATIITTCCGV